MVKLRSNSRLETRTIVRVERLPNTKWGNPRYNVQFTDGSQYKTEPDADIGMITNPEYQGVPVLVEITPGGRIINITVTAESSPVEES